MGNGKTQHARIVAFSPPSVKGGQVALRVLVNAECGFRIADLPSQQSQPGALELSFDPVLGMEMAAALRTLLGEPAPKQKRPNHKLAPLQLAKYRAVVAAVNAGATWERAAALDGVKAQNVKVWWRNQQKRSVVREPGAPILKPSGEIS